MTRHSIVVLLAVIAVLAAVEGLVAQRGRVSGEGFVSEGVPRMPNPPGPAPKRDLSGAWVGPRNTNKPDPIPPMTPAGQAIFKTRNAYGAATRPGGKDGQLATSNDPFITCDPLGFPRNLLAHAITSRGGTLFGSAPNRILIAPPLVSAAGTRYAGGGRNQRKNYLAFRVCTKRMYWWRSEPQVLPRPERGPMSACSMRRPSTNASARRRP